MLNYYHVLGLSENASQEEIKAAFKRLAVKYHPDKHQGDPAMEEKFKEINVAYQVLSDEYEKARFDLKLKYQQFAHTQTPTQDYRPPYQTAWKRQAYRKYYRPPVDYRQNAIATAYAFGITFLIALLVMSGVWIKQSYDEHQLEKRLAERRGRYTEARGLFESGAYREAFEIMTAFDFFRTEEHDIRSFKESMLDKIVEKGNQAFQAKNYEQAIAHYEMVREFAPKLPFYEVKKKLVEAYRKNMEPEKAIEILKEFLLTEYEPIWSLVTMAKIQRDNLNQPYEALDNLQTAHRLAVKRYKTFYGDGYALVINQRHLPDSHYELYANLADIYLRLGDYEMALKAADWNKYVWPDSASSYLTSAQTYEKMGMKQKACIEYSGARDRKWEGTTPKFCK